MSDLQWLLNVIRNLARWPFIGDDGLTPWDRRRLTREFERVYLSPLNRPRCVVGRCHFYALFGHDYCRVHNGPPQA